MKLSLRRQDGILLQVVLAELNREELMCFCINIYNALVLTPALFCCSLCSLFSRYHLCHLSLFSQSISLSSLSPSFLLCVSTVLPLSCLNRPCMYMNSSRWSMPRSHTVPLFLCVCVCRCLYVCLCLCLCLYVPVLRGSARGKSRISCHFRATKNGDWTDVMV